MGKDHRRRIAAGCSGLVYEEPQINRAILNGLAKRLQPARGWPTSATRSASPYDPAWPSNVSVPRPHRVGLSRRGRRTSPLGANVFDRREGHRDQSKPVKITDAQLKLVATFPKLTDLSLEQTMVTGKGLAHLPAWPSSSG